MYCMRVVHAQHMSCRDACVAHAAMVNCQTVGVRAGLHTNLADERERVERAGMVQMHHDGVVHDGQAPPAASSSHGACARPASFPPPVCSTREVSSKLVTGSSSSAAVGETVARHAIEPRSSHGRHGGRERRGQLALAKFLLGSENGRHPPSRCAPQVPFGLRKEESRLGLRAFRPRTPAH